MATEPDEFTQMTAGKTPSSIFNPLSSLQKWASFVRFSHTIFALPFASGSNPPDAMVVIPCTMGTLGRIAHGYSADVLLRAADVVLKENKKLILVPRETPLSLIHVKNFELLLLAGATLIPANPSFYSGAKTVVALADTVVARVLDHLGVANQLAPRWAEERE